MAGPAKGTERGRNEGHLIRRRIGLVQPAGEPAQCVALTPRPVAETDQSREFKRLVQAKRASLAGFDLRDDATLPRSIARRKTALACPGSPRFSSVLGPDIGEPSRSVMPPVAVHRKRMPFPTWGAPLLDL